METSALPVKLSLLVPYRNRASHLASLLLWVKEFLPEAVEIVVAEASTRPTVEGEVSSVRGCVYQWIECTETFHLSRALNCALERAQGQFVAPFDVDLIPLPGVLERHLGAALACPVIVFAGYRLLSSATVINVSDLSADFADAEISTEDKPRALIKRMKTREVYGAVPILDAERLRRIGGWDEEYLGWGAEDQDMLERYIGRSGYLVRSEEFVYLHQSHVRDEDWYASELTEKNRERYYTARNARDTKSDIIDKDG